MAAKISKRVRSSFTSQSVLITFTLVLLLLATAAWGASKCPPSKTIHPCTCVESSIFEISLSCTGNTVTQASINDLFSAVRSVNDITNSTPFDDPLRKINHLAITGTRLVAIDLSPFLGWSFYQFYVYRNQWLASLVGPPAKKFGPASPGISAIDVQLDTNSLKDDSVNQMVRCLYPPEKVKEFVLRENKITGAAGSFPSLDGLSELRKLDLAYNHIKKLEGGQFKNLTRLEQLHLEGNDIAELGRNALQFDESDEPLEDELLTIYLDSNQLTDDGIVSDNGLESIRRSVKLYLRRNRFEFISQKNFEKFLLSNKSRVVKFWAATFVCDDRMAWLKHARKVESKEGLHNSVFGIHCTNDETKHVFNSNKIVT